MIERLEEQYFRFNRWLSPVGAGIAVLFGISVLVGWGYDIDILRSFPQETYQAKPLTAIGLIIAGISLFALVTGHGTRPLLALGNLLGLVFAAIGVFIVADQLLIDLDLGSGSLLFSDRLHFDPLVPLGRPAIETGVVFVLSAFGILGLGRRSRWAVLAANISTVVAMMIVLVAIILYIFDFRGFQNIPGFTSIALNTAVAVLVLTFAILLAYRERGLLSILWSRTGGGILARRLFPFIFVVPIIFGWLRHQGEKAGLYGTEFGIALFTAGTVIGFGLIVFFTARTIESFDLRRQIAENAVVRKALMIGSSLEPMMIWSPERGILEWNTGCEKLYGFSAEEALGRTSIDLLKTRMKPGPAEFQRALEESGKWSGEVEQTTRSGEMVITESAYQLIESDGELLIIQHDRDITERKRYEQAIIQAKELNDYTINSLPAIFFLFDSAGRMKKWNQNFLRITGYTAEEMGEMQPLDFIVPDDHTLVAEKIQEVMTTGKAEAEARLMTADARVIPFYFLGSRITVEGQICVVGSGTDITAQKRAIEAAKESEERYRLLFDSNPCPMWVYDRETLQFLAVNEAAVKSYGFTRREFLSMNMTQIRPEEELPRLYQRLAGEIKTLTHPTPWTHRRKDGSKFEVEITSHALEFNGRQARLVMAIDVTQRSEALKQLRESEALFKSVFDQQFQFMMILSPERKIMQVNELSLKASGYEREDLLGKNFWEIPLWPQREKMKQEWNRRLDEAVATGRSVIGEEYFVTASGERRLAESATTAIFGPDGTVSHYVVQAGDATARREAEESLRESEQRFRRMFDIVSIGIAQADAQTGRFILFNRRFAEIAGYPVEDLRQMTFKQLTHPEDAEADARKFFEARDGKAPQYINEKRYLRPDGSIVWVRVNASFVRDADGTALQSIGVIEDITEQKRARDELLELNATLEERVEERTRKLETLNRELEAFSYSVSHDLRAPLRAMDGFSQAVLEDYADKLDENGVDYLNRIRSASQRMASMIDSLLGLSRVSRSALSIGTTDLTSMAREIASDLAAASPDRIVEVSIEDGLTAKCDARLARIALENMLGNAWKFTSKTENASVSFSRGPEPGEFVIRDNGAGFEATYADTIFGAFSRLHRSDEFEGTGIGLATVYRIIQMHGGTIRAESEPGQGAAFFFTFTK
ncbi:MAG: PAS domain S-box protein [Acidobacteria bacterium]|nr:PAS domain S-box protein [Acidobacteriota bacterium]